MLSSLSRGARKRGCCVVRARGVPPAAEEGRRQRTRPRPVERAPYCFGTHCGSGDHVTAQSPRGPSAAAVQPCSPKLHCTAPLCCGTAIHFPTAAARASASSAKPKSHDERDGRGEGGATAASSFASSCSAAECWSVGSSVASKGPDRV